MPDYPKPIILPITTATTPNVKKNIIQSLRIKYPDTFLIPYMQHGLTEDVLYDVLREFNKVLNIVFVSYSNSTTDYSHNCDIIFISDCGTILRHTLGSFINYPGIKVTKKCPLYANSFGDIEIIKKDEMQYPPIPYGCFTEELIDMYRKGYLYSLKFNADDLVTAHQRVLFNCKKCITDCENISLDDVHLCISELNKIIDKFTEIDTEHKQIVNNCTTVVQDASILGTHLYIAEEYNKSVGEYVTIVNKYYDYIKEQAKTLPILEKNDTDIGKIANVRKTTKVWYLLVFPVCFAICLWQMKK